MSSESIDTINAEKSVEIEEDVDDNESSDLEEMMKVQHRSWWMKCAEKLDSVIHQNTNFVATAQDARGLHETPSVNFAVKYTTR